MQFSRMVQWEAHGIPTLHVHHVLAEFKGAQHHDNSGCWWAGSPLRKKRNPLSKKHTDREKRSELEKKEAKRVQAPLSSGH